MQGYLMTVFVKPCTRRTLAFKTTISLFPLSFHCVVASAGHLHNGSVYSFPRCFEGDLKYHWIIQMKEPSCDFEISMNLCVHVNSCKFYTTNQPGLRQLTELSAITRCAF